MERAKKRFLAQAEKHILEAERLLVRQRKIVAELERDGHDSHSAREFLTQFEAMLALVIQSRDWAKAELGSN
jgi:hypothetical protein